MNEYQFITFDGLSYTLHATTDQSEYFIQQYNKVNIYQLWINGVEWVEPRIH